MMANEDKDRSDAQEFLRGRYRSPEDVLALAKNLKDHKDFHLARQILARARRDPAARQEPENPNLLVQLGQHQAVCTYKDPDLPTESRLKRAFEILQEIDDPKNSADQETLGIAGAIHKYRWQWDGQRENLELAKDFYLSAYQRSYFLKEGEASKVPDESYDQGWTGVNAAFVLDLLASLEEEEARKANISSKAAAERRRQAADIRKQLLEHLPHFPELAKRENLKSDYWFLATLAEANFGLGNDGETIRLLTQANQESEDGRSQVPDWELETTARQLVALAEIREPKPGPSAIQEVLTKGLSIAPEAVQSAVRGKVGLALSGGGFRASLFHIGVLAKLAELDMLRHVEVLSCVSGGSIIGACYYLELRQLLQEKADNTITAADYVAIIRRVTKDFLEGVQGNLRTQVLADPTIAWRMIREPGFSETERLRELYVEKLFPRTPSVKPQDIPLRELKIQPKDGAPNFNPKLHNWSRQAKVPTLILNATTLNSCHNWQFTSTWMGESPALIDTNVDGNDRLRRMYHRDAPEKYRNNPVPLGRAVAASACVPGLFAPITLPDLYPDYTVRLVDGGVFDNQGAAGLVEQDCTVLLVSDASGQTDCEGEPDVSRLGVLMRSNNILQARVREAQYHDQLHRLRSRVLRGLMFLHLRKDLNVDPVNWCDCADPIQGTEEARPIEQRGTLTTYGVRKDVQEKLAALRTDLDAFSDLEAYALMTSGYLMASSEFRKGNTGLQVKEVVSENWPFLAVKDWMSTPGQGPAERLQLLDFGRYQGMKYWRMSTGLRLLTVLGGAVGLLLLGWLVWATWPQIIGIAGWLLVILVGLAAASFLVGLAVTICPSYASTVRRIREWTRKVGFGLGCLPICPFAWIYLKIFNGWFLKQGEIKPAGAKAPAKSPPAATPSVTPS